MSIKKLSKHIQQRGAATLLFISLMAVIITIMLAAAQSQLLLALRRQQSSGDSLVAAYQAESEANDVMARLEGGYLTTADLNETFDINGTSITLKGIDEGTTQTVTVIAKRDFAVSEVEAVRKIESIKKVNTVDIILGMDCTASMDASASIEGSYSPPTRFDAQTEAANAFIDKIISLKDADKFRLGVIVFGIDAKWLTLGADEVRPDNTNLSHEDIKTAINDGFGSTRSTSSACQTVMDATSMGSPFAKAYEYFSANESADIKQIAVVISDGAPNSRVPTAGCGIENVFCPAFPRGSSGENYCDPAVNGGLSCYREDEYIDGPYESDGFNPVAFSICQPLGVEFLACTVADNTTEVSLFGSGETGIRKPEVDAYAVTVFYDPPSNVVSILNNYATQYFNATRADQLKNILNTVLNEILKERSTIIVRRIVPTPI